MRCSDCNARLPVGATFCPDCGAATRPESGARHADKDIDDIRAGRRRVFTIGAVVLIVVAIVGRGGWMMDFGSHSGPDHHGGTQPTVVEARQLFEAYRDDEGDAEDRFGGRGLVVTGTFLRVNNDDAGSPDLRLETSDPATPLGIDVVEDSHDAARALQPGQKVTVSCERVTENGQGHWLQNCRIEPITLAPIAANAPTAPEAPAPPAAPMGEAETSQDE